MRTGRPISVPDRKMIRISFEGQQVEALKKLSAITEISVACHVRKAVDAYLANLDQT